ncbi:MAG: Flp family type IVb pilin [Caulobacterales bacterium]|uniref:Flp family type IVb pilin n=1 Tax=Glycocaulis sp. TaxID=1969725 RepID=UPI003FA01C3B
MGKAAGFEQVRASARRHSLGRRAARPSLSADTRGATAIEYGMIAALIAIVILAALMSISGESGALWETVSSALAGEAG